MRNLGPESAQGSAVTACAPARGSQSPGRVTSIGSYAPVWAFSRRRSVSARVGSVGPASDSPGVRAGAAVGVAFCLGQRTLLRTRRPRGRPEKQTLVTFIASMPLFTAVGVFALLFIAGMAFLRTRMQYRPPSRAGLRLTGAGGAYFAILAALLAAAWLVAPLFTGADPFATTLARVIGFLVVYFLSIPAHQLLRARGTEVFKTTVAQIQQRP